MEGFGTSPFVLPNVFEEPGKVLGDIIQNKRQDKQIADQVAYRQQKEAEQDQWKKLGLIQDLTDLSKHQTGDDVANAIGYQKASEILQKYTKEAPNMSPNELMAKVQQDMSGLVSGMDAMKNELNMSDEQLKLLKKDFPELDISSLAKAHRADILNRRVKGDKFVNPIEVPASQLDLSDPEVLADFVSDDRSLINSITNPKGVENESVLMGRQGDYTKFEGKLPFWKAPNYDRKGFNSEGFYTGREIPSFKIKGTELPSDALPSSNGKPFKIIDKDVYDQFISDGNNRLNIIAAAKNRYPDYNNFNATEKEYAQRNVLYDKIETLDPSQLHPTQNVRPPVTKNYMGGSSSKKETPPWDLTEYPDTGDGGKNLTVPFQGYVVTAIGNNKLLAKNVIYYPQTKQFKVTEYTGRDTEGNPTGEKTSIIKASTFRQNIKGNNPQADMKEFDALVGTEAKGQDTVGGTIKGSEVPKGAKVTQKDGAYYYNGKKII